MPAGRNLGDISGWMNEGPFQIEPIPSAEELHILLGRQEVPRLVFSTIFFFHSQGHKLAAVEVWVWITGGRRERDERNCTYGRRNNPLFYPGQ